MGLWAPQMRLCNTREREDNWADQIQYLDDITIYKPNKFSLLTQIPVMNVTEIVQAFGKHAKSRCKYAAAILAQSGVTFRLSYDSLSLCLTITVWVIRRRSQ